MTPPESAAIAGMAPPTPAPRALPHRLWQACFGSWLNGVITVASILVVAWALPPLLAWGVTTAQWSGTAADCRAPGVGACWAFVADKLRFLVFGFYPAESHARPLLMMVLFLAMIAVSTVPRFWRRGLVAAWAVTLPVMYWLMAGGILLEPVPTRLWGGLPLTLMLAVFGQVLAFPLAIVLALGRQSDIPVIRTACIAFIELVRGVPLISILFMASIMLPLFLPDGGNIDKVVRAQIAFVLFASAYLAEVVRGGLQAIPPSQYEAAKALGLGYWRRTLLVILPQALRIAIPPLISTFIAFFKDTSLVVIVGLTDFFGAIRIATNDPQWLGFHVEGYLFAVAVYFTFCKALAAYGLFLERRSSRRPGS